MERLLETVLENAHKVGNVVVVGAGRRGRELLFHLNKEKSICVLCIFDNAIEEDKIGEVSVSHPYNKKGKGDFIMTRTDLVNNIAEIQDSARQIRRRYSRQPQM